MSVEVISISLPSTPTKVVDRVLGEWVTESDGTAAIVDERRRRLRLL